MDLGYHIGAADDDRRALGRAEGHVQHRPVLRDVDPPPAEHVVRPLADLGPLGQRPEELERLAGDQVLRVVKVEVGRLDRHGLATAWIADEELPEMDALELGEVGPESLPLDGFGDSRRARGHAGRLPLTPEPCWRSACSARGTPAGSAPSARCGASTG